MTDKTNRTIAEVIAKQVRKYRDAAGLRQQDLADRMTELGHPIHQVTLAKIEKGGTRADNLSVVDLLALAAALDVSPLLLILSLDEGDEIAVTPKLKIRPYSAMKWMAGKEPLADSDGLAHNLTAWNSNTLPLFLYETLDTLWARVSKAWPRDGGGDQGRADEALRDLAQHMALMERSNYKGLPDLPDEWRQRLSEFI